MPPLVLLLAHLAVLHLIFPTLPVFGIFDITGYPPVLLRNRCVVACCAADAAVLVSFDCGSLDVARIADTGLGEGVVERRAGRIGNAASGARVRGDGFTVRGTCRSWNTGSGAAM